MCQEVENDVTDESNAPFHETFEDWVLRTSNGICQLNGCVIRELGRLCNSCQGLH